MAKQGLHEDLAARLLDWYDAQARDLPWRSKPGLRPDPYHVWLSEIMLQQTRAATVTAYFDRFLKAWPSVTDLAHASLDDVLKAWAGLGYYARARNLHACAKIIAGDLQGRFPETEKALRALPGIGPYTEAAISAIAFNRPHAAIDGNAERVISRLYALKTPLPESKPKIRALAQALIPENRAGDFAQSLMDLGATICTPRSPDCQNCPWADHCRGRRAGIAASLPRRKSKSPPPLRYGAAFWIERRDGAVLLRRRPEKGMLGGMMEVPSTPWVGSMPRNVRALAPVKASWKKQRGRVEHTFTHFHLELSVLKAKAISNRAPEGGYRWVAPEALAGEALPSLMRKVVALVLG
ncbi:MAG: A/G-specific adenine glycosylase [Aestuariivirga sp.]